MTCVENCDKARRMYERSLERRRPEERMSEMLLNDSCSGAVAG